MTNPIFRIAMSFALCSMSIPLYAERLDLIVCNAVTNETVLNAEVSLQVITRFEDPWKGFGDSQSFLQPMDTDGVCHIEKTLKGVEYAIINIRHSDYYPNAIAFKACHGSLTRIPLIPKIKPIPLIAIDFGRWPLKLDLKGEGTTKAFDCFKADWLPPYGQGNHADILFSLERYKIKERAFAAFKIKFVNEHDGLMPVETVYASNMAIREAPEKMQLIREMEIPLELTREGYPSDFPKLKCYCFRVRTEKTPSGEILSAYYGKLYRAFSLDSLVGYGEFGFEYYFNPAPNDRNLEYNGEMLLKPKKSIQGIREIR